MYVKTDTLTVIYLYAEVYDREILYASGGDVFQNHTGIPICRWKTSEPLSSCRRIIN